MWCITIQLKWFSLLNVYVRIIYIYILIEQTINLSLFFNTPISFEKCILLVDHLRSAVDITVFTFLYYTGCRLKRCMIVELHLSFIVGHHSFICSLSFVYPLSFPVFCAVVMTTVAKERQPQEKGNLNQRSCSCNI